MNCPTCGRDIPADSKICPYCGTRVAPTEVADRPATGPTQRFESPDEITAPLGAEPSYPADRAGRAGASFGPRQAVPIGAIWLFGIATLAITGWWWPGILILVGLSAFVGMLNRGQPTQALSPLIFFIGLAILAWTDWWWPGMLILIGIMMLLNAGTLRNLGR